MFNISVWSWIVLGRTDEGAEYEEGISKIEEEDQEEEEEEEGGPWKVDFQCGSRLRSRISHFFRTGK